MPLPAPLETVTVRGTWMSPATGAPLEGWAELTPVNAVLSPAGDVLLTTSPSRKTLAAGVAEWTGVLFSDSAGLSGTVLYRVRVVGDGYVEDRRVQLLKSAATGGVIQLADVATATTSPGAATYVLTASVGTVGGPAGPLDASGKVPSAQLPAAAGGVPASRLVNSGTGLSGGGDLSADRTLAVVYGTTAGTAAQGNDSRLSDARTPLAHTHPESDVTNLVADLAAKVPASTVDAKGDLLVATAADTVGRLAVGSNGQLPMADSSQAAGIRWSARTAPAYSPTMDGLVAAAADPAVFRSQGAIGAAGWAVRMLVPAGAPITGALTCLHTAGTLAGGGTNGFAVNDDTGALVASTVDDNTLWTAAGMRAKAFSAPIAAQTTDRYVYVSLRVTGYSADPALAFVDGSSSAARLDGLQGGKRRVLVLGGSAWGAIDPAAGTTGGGFMPLLALY